MKKSRPGKRKESFNARKFVSAEAEDRHDTTVLYKTILPERGFHNPGGQVEGQIEAREWHYFTRAPSHACVGLVREFYSNAPYMKDTKVFVRGKWVAFDSHAINNLYNLVDFDGNDEYPHFRTGEVDYEHIRVFLCGGEDKVSWKRSGSTVTNFPASGMDSKSKAWHYFITARLLPSGNTSEVTRERAILNYAIQTSLTIDVGKVIYQSILHTIQTNAPVALGHPSVIHELCMAHDVEFASSEELLSPRTTITKSKIHSYSARSFSEPGEASAAAPSPRSQGKPLNLTEHVSRLREDVSGLRSEFTDFRSDFDEHQRYHVRKDRREAHRAQQDDVYRKYMVECQQIHNQMSAAAQSGEGTSHLRYPDPPVFPEYQEEEEEEEGEEEYDE